MTLQDWRPKGTIEKEIRGLLKTKRQPSTTDDCKVWARLFIQKLIPSWQPGKDLTTKQAQTVGKHFNRLLCRPKPKPPKQDHSAQRGRRRKQ